MRAGLLNGRMIEAGNRGSGAVLVFMCTSGTTVEVMEESEHAEALAALADGHL